MNRFNIKKVNIMATWSYHICSNTDCSICYNSLSCSSVPDFQNGKDSRIKVGKCGHAFHEDCLNPWIENNPRCPICVSDWVDTTPVDLNK